MEARADAEDTPRKRQLRERIHALEEEVRRRKTTRPAPQPGGRPPKGLMWDGWGVDAAGEPNGCFVDQDGKVVDPKQRALDAERAKKADN